MLSLISFDVQGAYNGVCTERLLERLRARGLPDGLVRWVGAFCSGRMASIIVNGHTSEHAGIATSRPAARFAAVAGPVSVLQHGLGAAKD